MTITLEDATVAAVVWHDVCWTDDLRSGWGEAAWLDGQQVALFRFTDGSLYAAAQTCPGTGAQVMSRGIMGSRTVDGELVKTIASPLHKEIYRLDTGECLNADGFSLPVYPVRVENERIWVGVSQA